MNEANIATIIAFILGSCIGSFLSVFIDRHYHSKPGIINGRSECPHCHKKLKFLDLIPIISYLIRFGKCHYCHKKIGRSYFYLEVVTGLIFALWINMIPFYQTLSLYPIIEFSLSIILSLTFITIFFYDLKFQVIPDSLNLPAIGLSAALALFTNSPTWPSIGIGLLMIIIFFGGQIIISQERWLGTGDLILGLSMAILLGWEKLLLAIILAYIIGASYAITLILTKKAQGKTAIAFAPFLITATFISWLLGDELIYWYLQLVLN